MQSRSDQITAANIRLLPSVAQMPRFQAPLAAPVFFVGTPSSAAKASRVNICVRPRFLVGATHCVRLGCGKRARQCLAPTNRRPRRRGQARWRSRFPDRMPNVSDGQQCTDGLRPAPLRCGRARSNFAAEWATPARPDPLTRFLAADLNAPMTVARGRHGAGPWAVVSSSIVMPTRWLGMIPMHPRRRPENAA
jgi:hypothetical protein